MEDNVVVTAKSQARINKSKAQTKMEKRIEAISKRESAPEAVSTFDKRAQFARREAREP